MVNAVVFDTRLIHTPDVVHAQAIYVALKSEKNSGRI